VRLTKVLKATISKDPSIDGSNEDAAVLRLYKDEQRAAVFDGASESFAARRWSKTLANEWGREQAMDGLWLERSQTRYKNEIDEMELSWAQEAAMERGSFATIASIEVQDEFFKICIVGDSSIFFIDNRGVRWSYPFQSEVEFSSIPVALSSRPTALEQNYELIRKGTKPPGTFLKAIGTRHLLLATDAVSCWLLADDMSTHLTRLFMLFACKTSEDFHELVLRERASSAMKIDDSTIILLRID
jgi:hypothetical protein